LPLSFTDALWVALQEQLPTLSHWEISNVIWSLGKTNADYERSVPAELKEAIMKRLADAASKLKQFDLESIFVGLGLMEVCNMYYVVCAMLTNITNLV
jgi:hypothetical protein